MSARTDLRGGWRATAIPTATSFRATTKDENEPGEQSFVFKEIDGYFRRE